MFWGFSEALDLFEEYLNAVKPTLTPTKLNFLLIGNYDPRHIIKSIAKSYLHSIELHFYIIEDCPSSIARNLLLTSIAFESPEDVSLKRKTDLFMDLYGNALLRPSSAGYLTAKANHLIKCVTDLEFNDQMQSLFDLTHLKYAERDALESFINFWRKHENQFDIKQQWNQLVKKHLGQRYDSRNGIFDWDLHMRLKEYGGAQICAQEYRHWRETGVAFISPEHRQTIPNKTMAVSLREQKFPINIEIGPYCAFGLNCDDLSLLKSYYGQNECRATDITERNIYHLFYEIEYRRPCPADIFKPNRLGSAIIDTTGIVSKGNSKDDELNAFTNNLINFKNRTKIIYLSPKEFQSIIDGKKFTNFFDLIFVGRNHFQFLNRIFIKLLTKPVSIILFETGQHSVLRKEEISEILLKIKKFTSEMNFKSVTNFSVNLPLTVAKYKFIESESE